MASAVSTAYDRVVERRRAVALARHFRDAERLSIVQIADRLGRSPATIKAYFYDPTGERRLAPSRPATSACAGAAARTRSRATARGTPTATARACHPRSIQPRWTCDLVIRAMREWCARHERLPSSYDWSRTHARQRGREALERLAGDDAPHEVEE
jgi:hypothetical protein